MSFVAETSDIRAELEHAASELDLAENALLCSSFHNAASRAKAAPAGDVRYEFSVFDGMDQWEAGGDAPTLEEAMQEGQHYLAVYSGDHCGPYRLELRRTELLPLPEAQP